MPEPKTKTKRKRINVKAGIAVEIRHFSESELPEARLNQVDLEDCDDEPLNIIRDKLLQKQKADSLEAGPSYLHEDFSTEHFEEENSIDSNLGKNHEV